MFNNELSLNDSEFENFLYYDISKIRICDISKIRICFNTRHIPRIIPSKWREKEFNALSLTLILIEINKLNLQGERVGFLCSPAIEKIGNEIIFSIDNEDKFHLSCTAELIVVDSVEPYLDQLWK